MSNDLNYIETELSTLNKTAARIAVALERIAEALHPASEEEVGVLDALLSIDTSIGAIAVAARDGIEIMKS